MKRLNPQTGVPFKRGDIREDGKIFQGYQTKLRLNGTFLEVWLNPKIFKSHERKGYDRNDKYFVSIEGRATRMLDAAKRRHDLKISREWLIAKLKSGVCEITGIPFSFIKDKRYKNNPYAPSLDRIDSQIKEYTEKNTRVVLVAVNLALSEFGEKTMMPILKAMVDSNKGMF